MSAYLKKSKLIYPKSIGDQLPEKIVLTQPSTTLGNGDEFDVSLVHGMKKSSFVSISRDSEKNYFLETCGVPVIVNDREITEKFALRHGDQIHIGENYVFHFMKADKPTGKTPRFLGSSTKRLEQDAVDSVRSPGRGESGSLSSYRGTDRTMAFEAPKPQEVGQRTPQLISPANGQVVGLGAAKTTVGRSPDCDLRLSDDYVSRRHLEITPAGSGFEVKNVGRNEIIVEKKHYGSPNSFEEVRLSTGDSTIVEQEAALLLGTQIVYYFAGQAENEDSVKARKCEFYKDLASRKEELLHAGQLQKILTPACTIFEDLQVGLWFKYFALDDLSGDFFLYNRKDDGVYFCMGDVSGHGPAAAIMASQVAGMFKILSEHRESPRNMVEAINDQFIQADVRKLHLYTLLNVLRIASESVELCIAGNAVPPLFYRAAERNLISLGAPSNPVGVFESGVFKSHRCVLDFAPNDMIILFTDGVTEANKFDGPMIGYKTVQEQIGKFILDRVAPKNFLDNFLWWLVNNCEIKDDLSIALIVKLGE